MESALPPEIAAPSGVVRTAGDFTALRLASRILDTAPVAVAYVSAGMAVLQCNAAAARLFGKPAEEIVGKPLRSAASGSPLLEAARAATVSMAPTEGILRSAAGVETTMSCTPDTDAKGRLLGVVLTEAPATRTSAEDTSRAEKALRDSEALFRATFELSPAGVVQADAEGRLVRVNRRFAEMLGYPIAALQGMTWSDITPADDGEGDLQTFHLLTSGTRDEVSFEKRYLRSDGKALWTLTALAAVRSDEGELRFIAGVVQDISEHKQAEEFAIACSRIDSAIHSTLDFGDIMQRVVVEAVEALRCDSGRVALREGERWVTRFGYLLPPCTEDEVYADEDVPEFVLAARKHRVVAIDDAEHDVRTRGDAMRAAGVRSVLVVPLVSRDQVVGVISFAYRSRHKRFSAADVSFADHVASSASVALENARLYDTQHMLADTLQDAMVRMPEAMAGIDFAWLYRSATEAARVGGDFLDVFALDGGRVGVVVGDVSGKGVQAAALATLLKNVVRAYAYEDASPARVVERLNRMLEHETAEDVFATVFLAILDPLTGWLSYCSGGHPPALLRRAVGGIRVLGAESPLVGAIPDLSFEEGFERLGRGDVLLMFSDGVLEARNGTRETFGEERLIESFAGAGRMETACEDVFQAVSSFSQGSLEDDVALLAIRLDSED